jgi:predicted RND superfamily exporter protein
MNKRMCYTFRRARGAMAVTSSTTSAAFLANYFGSPLLSIKSFGIFSCVIVPINYLLVVTFMPSIIFIHESECFNKLKCCFKKKDIQSVTSAETIKELSKTEKFF